MLKPEHAQTQLKEFQVEKGEARRLDRIAGLPEALRAIGYGLVGRKPDGSACTSNEDREGSLKAQALLHLGSAVVHIQPGGHLCIVPVPSQHRGRLFLPFAADDPKTAEVVSKVVLLAVGKEIQDPTILEQILPRN